MIRSLQLENVGPAPRMDMTFTDRVNVITGDNGLGKSFLLDVIWWSLTRVWPQDLNARLTSGYAARPTDVKKSATIGFSLNSKSKKDVAYVSKYSPRDQAWLGKAGRPFNPGLVIYAHADGGFSIWDPARNYWKTKGGADVYERLPGFVFSPQEVWDGLEVERDGKKLRVCEGLIRDWAGWIKANDSNARLMNGVIGALSRHGDRLSTGPLTRLSLDDARDIPTLNTGYAEAVPVLHASSGVRRMLALGYMLVWSWREHYTASVAIGEEPTPYVTMLVDEIESHLHPKWQRTILNTLNKIMSILHKQSQVQLVVATHSPLILVGMESFFDPAQDSWFDLDFDPAEKQVSLTKREFVRRGAAGRWLTSDAFDLASEGRPVEAETAIRKAEELLARRRNGDKPTKKEIEAADAALAAILPDIDGFWLRWRAGLGELLCEA